MFCSSGHCVLDLLNNSFPVVRSSKLHLISFEGEKKIEDKTNTTEPLSLLQSVHSAGVYNQCQTHLQDWRTRNVKKRDAAKVFHRYNPYVDVCINCGIPKKAYSSLPDLFLFFVPSSL